MIRYHDFVPRMTAPPGFFSPGEYLDAQVRPHVDYFTSQLTAEERETAISTLMFYVGPGALKRRSRQ